MELHLPARDRGYRQPQGQWSLLCFRVWLSYQRALNVSFAAGVHTTSTELLYSKGKLSNGEACNQREYWAKAFPEKSYTIDPAATANVLRAYSVKTQNVPAYGYHCLCP